MKPVQELRESYIDSLRGIAVISVVSVHCLQVANSESLKPQQAVLFEIGQYGVELFFLISGWLMYMLYGKSTNFSIKIFARRRFARIYPLWALFVVIGSLMNFAQLSPFYGTITNSDRFSDITSFALTLLLGLTFTLWTFGPFWNSVVPGGWSIQCEVYNYLAFAIFRKFSLRTLIVFTTTINLSFNLILKILLNGNFTFLSGPLNAFNRLNLLNSFSYFLLGILLFKAYTLFSTDKKKFFQIQPSRTDVVLVLSFIFSILLTPIAFGNQTHCIFYVLTMVLLCGLLRELPAAGLFLTHVGKFSYSIYFTHFYFLSALIFLKPTFLLNPSLNVYLSWVSVTLLTLAITYIIGKFSWIYFESSMKRLLR